MYYIKLFEDFGKDLELEPEELGYDIIYNHPKGGKIMEFLDENIGDLTEFVGEEGETTYYGKSKDYIMFKNHFGYAKYNDVHPQYSILWVRYEDFWEVLGDKFDVVNVAKVLSWYITTKYDIKFDDIENSNSARNNLVFKP